MNVFYWCTCISTHHFVPGILQLIAKASCFYNKSYKGYTFILPAMDHSNSKPMQLSFSKAQQWCTKNVAGSILATIRNEDVQTDFTLFIQSALQDNQQLAINLYSNIILNGQYHITDEWRWLNGHQKAGMHRFFLLKSEIIVDHRKQWIYNILRLWQILGLWWFYPSTLAAPICRFTGDTDFFELLWAILGPWWALLITFKNHLAIYTSVGSAWEEQT